MDKPGRVLRGHGKTGDVVEGGGHPTRRGAGRTSIPVASTASAVGGRRNTAVTTQSGISKKTPSNRLKGNISPVRTRTSPSRTRTLPSRTRTSPSRNRTSPSRTRTSPARRSSRPRSTIPTVQVTSATNSTKLSTTKDDEEEEEKSSKQTNLPTTLTTNTSSKAPNRITTTSSTHSSYSSITQQTVEIRTSSNEPSEITKLAEFIRRSVSKTLSLGRGSEDRGGSATPSQRTDGDSRYSRSASRSVYDNDDRYSKAEFSDAETNDHDAVIYEEDGVEEPFKSFHATSAVQGTSLCRKLPIPTEFGGWLGALFLMIAIPCAVYYLQWCCSAQNCDLKLPDYKDILDANGWGPKLFEFEAVGAFLAFNLGIFVLSAVLLGRGVRLPGCVEYKFNALPMTVLVAAAYAGAIYFNYPVADFVLKNYQRMGVYSLLNAYVLALWAYFRSDVLKQKDTQCNIYAKSGNFVVDYALGRQLNPKWLGLVNFKLVFYRISLMSVFLHAVSLLYKNIQTPWIPKDTEGIEMISYFFKHLKYDTTAVICAIMVLMYVLDSITFEHHLASSFEMQGEGFGCLLLLRYAATPLLLTSVAKYFYENRTPLTCKFAVYVPLFLLVVGLALKRFSNAIKYKYRVQPNHPRLRNIETIHTFQGRRLLLGSLWGRVRQPNYLGDIICLVALGLPLAMRFSWPPFVNLLLIVIVLIHRCFRVNDRNTARYHSSWVRYRCIARNYLIPKIF